ncbi:MAG TPA: hypothetical protein VE616_23605 [Candidatus Udaeobacter sp.]|jgi:hypothetical protein|nr:hypothetical protein [Candidatus Udaeobacter sp.]
MNRTDVMELHYITAIANLTSILRHGILSQKGIGIPFDPHEQQP